MLRAKRISARYTVLLCFTILFFANWKICLRRSKHKNVFKCVIDLWASKCVNNHRISPFVQRITNRVLTSLYFSVFDQKLQY